MINSGSGAPFQSTLRFPAPEFGQDAIGVRYQPGTSLPSGASIPSGVDVAKVITIDVFNLTTGEIRRDHAEALVLIVNVTSDEISLCLSSSERLALLRVDQFNQVHRLPVTLDCTAGTMTATFNRTASLGVGRLSSGMTIPIKSFLGTSPRNTTED